MSILRKKVIDIPEPKDYDYSDVDNDIESCGLEGVTFGERNKSLFDNLIVDATKQNVVAVLCNRMENTFSKRELAFLLAKNTLIEQMKAERESSEKREVDTSK